MDLRKKRSQLLREFVSILDSVHSFAHAAQEDQDKESAFRYVVEHLKVSPSFDLRFHGWKPDTSRLRKEVWRHLRVWKARRQRKPFILESALESFDRMREAQTILEKEGIVIKDRFNQSRGC